MAPCRRHERQSAQRRVAAAPRRQPALEQRHASIGTAAPRRHRARRRQRCTAAERAAGSCTRASVRCGANGRLLARRSRRPSSRASISRAARASASAPAGHAQPQHARRAAGGKSAQPRRSRSVEGRESAAAPRSARRRVGARLVGDSPMKRSVRCSPLGGTQRDRRLARRARCSQAPRRAARCATRPPTSPHDVRSDRPRRTGARRQRRLGRRAAQHARGSCRAPPGSPGTSPARGRPGTRSVRHAASATARRPRCTTVPTGFSGVPPPGPAMPVIADADVGAGALRGSRRPSPRHRLAHRAVLGDERCRHAEQIGLGVVAVGRRPRDRRTPSCRARRSAATSAARRCTTRPRRSCSPRSRSRSPTTCSSARPSLL